MRIKTVRLLLMVTATIVVLVTYFVLLRHGVVQPRPPEDKELSLFIQMPSTLLSRQLSQTEAELSKNGSKLSSTSMNEDELADKIHAVVTTNTDGVLEMAKEIYREYGVVLFAMINDAYFDFAASWCCNTAPFGDVHQHVLFLTTDVQTGRRVRSLWPNVSVAVMRSPQFMGSQDYSKAGYVRITAERTRFILRLLEAGVQLLLFEVDCVWLTNPLPLVLARQSEGDILATRVTGQDVTAIGFLLLNPTRATVRVWQQLTHMLDDHLDKIKAKQNSAPVSEALNDQEFLTFLVRKKYAGVKIVYLHDGTFPDGKWYSLPEKERLDSRPAIINNNWVVGTDAKRQRAKAFGHWFWDESERDCNSTAIDYLHT